MRSFTRWLAAAAAIAVVLFAGSDVARADDVDKGVTYVGQRFEWQKKFSQRWAGTYGEYHVDLAAGVTYEFFTANAVGGSTADPYLYLMNAARTTVVAEDDDSGGSNHARIVFTPAAAGEYYVRLRAYPKNKYGFCDLTLRKQQAPLPPTEVTIGPGDVLNSQIFEWRSTFTNRYDGTYGQYRVDMTANTLYTFETSNASGGGADTYLYLLDSQLTVVKFDDDSGAGYHSKLSFQPAVDGTYYLRLRAYTKGAQGTCRLTVTGANLPPGNPLLPDVITWQQYLRDVRIQTSGGIKELRFSNAAANIGAGNLELYGVVASDGTTQAYQVVFNDNGSQTTHLVGTFSFQGHESHNHWHLDDFAIYQLVNPTTQQVVASGDKISFCLLDYVKYDSQAGPGVYTCDNQGISKGWADVYSSGLDGQFINITGVPDGTYELVSTADPLGRLHESSRTNNTARITIAISGNSVTVLP